MDEIIKLSCLQKLGSKNRWNIPTKMVKLNAIGVFVPVLLQRKISSVRNLLEHEYIRPKSQEVEDVIDIAELFLTSTEKYIEFGFLGAIDLIGRRYVIFNIVSDKIEIYGEKQEEIIDYLRLMKRIFWIWEKS